MPKLVKELNNRFDEAQKKPDCLVLAIPQFGQTGYKDAVTHQSNNVQINFRLESGI